MSPPTALIRVLRMATLAVAVARGSRSSCPISAREPLLRSPSWAAASYSFQSCHAEDANCARTLTTRSSSASNLRLDVWLTTQTVPIGDPLLWNGMSSASTKRGSGVQRREGAIGKVHQLRRVAVDADAARALGARHGAALRSGERACHRLPPKHVAVEETQARRVGGAEIGGDFDEALQHVARVGGELAGQHPERKTFVLVVRLSAAAASATR